MEDKSQPASGVNLVLIIGFVVAGAVVLMIGMVLLGAVTIVVITRGYKTEVAEGDFRVEMPVAVSSTSVESAGSHRQQTITVKMLADENGEISQISADDGSSLETFSGDADAMFEQLSTYVKKRVEQVASDDAGIAIIFETDAGLKYNFAVRAIEAVSKDVQPDGSIEKLVDKIEFKTLEATD